MGIVMKPKLALLVIIFHQGHCWLPYCPGMCSRTPWSRPRPDHFGSRPRTPMKSYMINEAP